MLLGKVLSPEVVGQALLVLNFPLTILEISFQLCVLQPQFRHAFRSVGVSVIFVTFAIFHFFAQSFSPFFVLFKVDFEEKSFFNQLVDVAFQPPNLLVCVFQICRVVLGLLMFNPVRLIFELGLLNFLL